MRCLNLPLSVLNSSSEAKFTHAAVCLEVQLKRRLSKWLWGCFANNNQVVFFHSVISELAFAELGLLHVDLSLADFATSFPIINRTILEEDYLVQFLRICSDTTSLLRTQREFSYPVGTNLIPKTI